tara:strand:- start:352 stop:753 length:402 start_codon:yes stop_codon:yes gene_type:complete
MSTLNNINVLFSGIIVGMIILQSTIIAPTIFTTLEQDNAGKLIRNIFPKLFKFIALLSLIMIINSFVVETSPFLKIIYFTTFLLMTINFLIIPATNKSRDEGNDKKFKLLHSLSVLTTILILLVHSYVIILGL